LRPIVGALTALLDVLTILPAAAALGCVATAADHAFQEHPGTVDGDPCLDGAAASPVT